MYTILLQGKEIEGTFQSLVKQMKRVKKVPHFLDSRLTDGCEVVSLTRRPPFTPWKILGTHIC
jgi:hypothetical protein